MNFFRDVTRRRRSSSASSAGDTSPTMSRKPPTCDNGKQQFTNKDTGQPNPSSYMSIGGKQVAFSSIGATATLRRVFLPRSRTTGFHPSSHTEKISVNEEKYKREQERHNNISGEDTIQNDLWNNGKDNSKKIPAQPLFGKKQQNKSYRSESLGRNVNKRTRSSTVPNFQDDNIIPIATFKEEDENIIDSQGIPHDNRIPDFSTFFKIQPNDPNDRCKLSEVETINCNSNSNPIENSSTKVATISRLSRSTSNRGSSSNEPSYAYDSTSMKRKLEPSQNTREDQIVGDNRNKNECNQPNVNHMMIFGAQAGGINLRRGRNNLRPLSADVSLLTSEGRKIGKQEQSDERGQACSTDMKNDFINDISARHRVQIGAKGDNRQSHTILSTSNSEFFRIVQAGKVRDPGKLRRNDVDSRDHSQESLLDSEDHTYLVPSSDTRMTNSNTQNSISTLNSMEYEIEDDDAASFNVRGTCINGDGNLEATTLSSLSCNKGPKSNENTGDMKKNQGRDLSQSRPQSTFGSLQMKVQELKAQLDVLKISGAESSSQCLQKALDRVATTNTTAQQLPKSSSSPRAAPPTTLHPPPPIDNLRSKNQSLQHPNTPAQGFEYTLPPNLINHHPAHENNVECSSANTISIPYFENNTNEIFFPFLAQNDLLSLSNPSSIGSGSSDVSMPTSNTPQDHLHLLQLQQALMLHQYQYTNNNTSSGPDTTDSLSPPVSPRSEGKRAKSGNSQPTISGNLNLLPGNSLITVPIRLPLSVAANAQYPYNGSLSSSSPSTLSPCSSNSTLPPSMPQSASSNQINHQPYGTNSTHPNQSSHRPQGLKLPQSQSLNLFPTSCLLSQQQLQASTPNENIDKVFFFFDVITTQDKIAKVRLKELLCTVLSDL